MLTTILITGANGFLAGAVAALAPPDWQLVGLVRPGGHAVARPGWHSLHDSLESLAGSGVHVDAVLHLAACIPADMRQNDPELIPSNVILPARILQQYPNARHVLASSVSVFGPSESLPLSVASPTQPITPYGLSKLAAEHLVRMAGSHAVLRLSSVIGRGMRPGTFIPAAIAAARAGRVTIHGDGSRMQDYIDVRDAARMCIEAAKRRDNFVTLVVSGRSHSNREVAAELGSLTGAEVAFTGEDASPSFAYTLAGATDLGRCEFSLRETLEEMVIE